MLGYEKMLEIINPSAILRTMILNKLNEEQLKRTNNLKERKIYEFLLDSRRNERKNKYIYVLTLNTNEKVVAQFETEIELEEIINGQKEKYCELSFTILNVVKKNKNSKLRKNKVLYFNYRNVFTAYELLEDDSNHTEILTKNQILKYNFEESFSIQTLYDKINRTLCMHLYFHPWAQKEKFKLSPKSDLEILLTFYNVKNEKGIKNKDNSEWEIRDTYIKDDKICFKTSANDDDLRLEKLAEISFDFDKAELKVVKEKYIYYYKGKYVD